MLTYKQKQKQRRHSRPHHLKQTTNTNNANSTNNTNGTNTKCITNMLFKGYRPDAADPTFSCVWASRLAKPRLLTENASHNAPSETGKQHGLASFAALGHFAPRIGFEMHLELCLGITPGKATTSPFAPRIGFEMHLDF